MNFLSSYIQFLAELEQIDKEYKGLTDSDVRERIYEIINYYFIWGKPIEADIPRYFFMPTPDGDKAVFKAVYTFIIDALQCAQQEGIQTPVMRHKSLENLEATTSSGRLYWEFLGFSETILPPKKPLMGDDYGYFNYENEV